jgi:glycosyltransferase involved in cell wall biosynthesis
MRVCLVYDCLFPWTIGGAERWYRNLGERLAAEGHHVTYLTLVQWDTPPCINGVDVVAVGPRMPLYKDGKRRLMPPLRFGLGVFLHLLRRGRHYDVVHTASFPYFSLLAAALARPLCRYRIVSDWHEVWSREYWREYLGALGFIGNAVQTLCARVPQTAYTFSRLHRDRLKRLGQSGARQLTGEYKPERRVSSRLQASIPHKVVYAGRFIPEKQLGLLVDAIFIASKRLPSLRAELIGDGPTRTEVIERIVHLGLEDVVSCPGFVSVEALDEAMSAALCVVQPSRREGYGMVVIEASHRGVPAIVVAAPDNAATELVAEGRNGFVVPIATPELLSNAIEKCEAMGSELRASTRDWYAANERRLSLETSLTEVVEDYKSGAMMNRTATIETAHA